MVNKLPLQGQNYVRFVSPEKRSIPWLQRSVTCLSPSQFSAMGQQNHRLCWMLFHTSHKHIYLKGVSTMQLNRNTGFGQVLGELPSLSFLKRKGDNMFLFTIISLTVSLRKRSKPLHHSRENQIDSPAEG